MLRSPPRPSGPLLLSRPGSILESAEALALWKVQRLVATPFRFRSGCHLRSLGLRDTNGGHVELNIDIGDAIKHAGFTDPRVTDVYWPREELYREGKADLGEAANEDENEHGDDEAESEINV